MAEEWLDPSTGAERARDLVLRRRHEAAYLFAAEFAPGERVVDVACGVGYGAGILGDGPASYAGVDRAMEALATARERAPGSRTAFACGDVAGGIPFRSGSGGVVLAFQIVEHLTVQETPAFLAELGRVCAPGGRIVLTTPNRCHRLLPFQRPWNPYHIREFDRASLGKLLRSVWDEVTILGLRADEEIERVELARVRQHPVLGYARPLARWLPESVRSWVADCLDAGGSPGAGGRAGDRALKRITADRFRVEDDPDGEGLDLVAVCRP